MQRVVVSGASIGTQGLLETLIASQLLLTVGCYEPDESLIDMVGLTALSQICQNTFGKSHAESFKSSGYFNLDRYRGT